jgi:hypothetical protein
MSCSGDSIVRFMIRSMTCRLPSSTRSSIGAEFAEAHEVEQHDLPGRRIERQPIGADQFLVFCLDFFEFGVMRRDRRA